MLNLRHLTLAAALWAAGGEAAAATVTVNTTADNGPGDCDTTCTLRDAVATAVTGDTVSLPAGTIVLDSAKGHVAVDKSLTIAGAGAGTTVVSGNNLVRIFKITAGTVSVASLSLTNGLAQGSNATGKVPGTALGAGGALWLADGATALLTDVVFADNQAVGGNGGDGNSTSSGAGGGPGSAGGDMGHTRTAPDFGGGGAGRAWAGDYTVGDGAFGGGGGGGYSDFDNGLGGTGGGDGSFGVNIFTISFGGGGGGGALGGAIFSEGLLVLRNVAFTANQARGGNGGAGYGSAGGGGGGGGLGSAVFVRTGGRLCADEATTFAGGVVAGGTGAGPTGENGEGLETSTGVYDQSGATCDTTTTTQSVTAPASKAGHLLQFSATVVAPFDAGGWVTFRVETLGGAPVGPAVTTAVAAGSAVTQYSLPAIAPGTYAIKASFAHETGLVASSSGTGALVLTQPGVASRTTTLAVGDSDCPNGGTKVETGRDDGTPSGVEWDSVLQDGEVESTEFVCEDPPATDDTKKPVDTDDPEITTDADVQAGDANDGDADKTAGQSGGCATGGSAPALGLVFVGFLAARLLRSRG